MSRRSRAPVEAGAGLPFIVPAPPPGRGFSPRRVGAMILRYWYLLRGSWPRLLELAYWPTMQVVLWGLISRHLLVDAGWAGQAAGVLISAVLLWDVLFRGQLGMSLSFFEEMWSRNMGHLFVSPLRPYEWVLSLMAMSLIRTLIGVVPAALLAILLYRYNIFGLGLPLAAFFANLLVTGWWIALAVVCLVLRYGMGAEGMAWIIVFMLAPISAVYYPVDVLPGWLHPVALALPPAHVFEGMRQVLFDGSFAVGHFAAATGLNIAYLIAGGAIFILTFRGARRRGALLQQGE